MINLFIKYIFIFFNSIYLFYKLLNHPLSHIRKLIQLFSLALFLTFIAIICKKTVPSLTLLVPLICFCLILAIYNQTPQLVFTTCTLSYALSYGFFIFSSLCITAIFVVNGSTFSSSSLSINILLTGILQSLLINSLFHIKRLKKGMPYLYNTKVTTTVIMLGSLIFISIAFIQIYPEMSILQTGFIEIFIIVIILVILHWWQSQLTKAYRKRLAQMELESLRTELEQKSILLKKLEAQNEEMGRLIHKDNKLIPAMEHAVSTYLTSDFTDLALHQAQGEALLIDLKELSAARQGILSTFTPAATPKYETGIPSLDAILVYMYQKAQSNGIRFYATATQESLAKCPTKLTNEKLVHLLSDLLENAIIATKSSSDKQIQLQIYLANGIFTIEIADTGLSFEPATLISFGLEKASTHLKDGGSGIGLLDIWKIKEEVKASIHIHEYETGTPFSKKIFISFDNRNKYVIHTWRDKELAPLVNRGDLVLLSQNQQTA